MIKRVYKVSKTVTPRSTQAVFNKLIEEAGELSVEINSKYHESYKKGGVDGIKGETVDILINCFDILYLEEIITFEKAYERIKNYPNKELFIKLIGYEKIKIKSVSKTSYLRFLGEESC